MTWCGCKIEQEGKGALKIRALWSKTNTSTSSRFSGQKPEESTKSRGMTLRMCSTLNHWYKIK